MGDGPQRLISRQFSCSSLMSAIGTMDAAQLLAALPDDPTELAKCLQDLPSQLVESVCIGLYVVAGCS